MIDDFYRRFEERHRGPRELILQRLQVYLPFVLPLRDCYPSVPAIDLGCGRGEWLETLAQCGIQAHGVDLDEGMLAACRERGLQVAHADAIASLQALPADSQLLVSAFHLAEHVPFAVLRTLVSQALRVLVPGGLLIIETPNPENLVVGTCDFYLDPTHIKPIPPDFLAFLAEHSGFARNKILRLQEAAQLRDEANPLNLLSVLGGASPDYAVVAQKAAPAAAMGCNNAAFETSYGVTLSQLAARYSAQQAVTAAELARQVAHALSAAQTASASAQAAQAAQAAAQALAQQAAQETQALKNSRSWRYTEPLRRALTMKAWLMQGLGAWLRFAPGSRPHRTALRLLASAMHALASRPRLKTALIQGLGHFPATKERLQKWRRMLGQSHRPASMPHMSPHAQHLHLQLRAAATAHHKAAPHAADH